MSYAPYQYYNGLQYAPQWSNNNYCPVPAPPTPHQHLPSPGEYHVYQQQHQHLYDVHGNWIAQSVTTTQTSHFSGPQNFVEKPDERIESASLVAEDLIKSFLNDLPNRHFLGKHLCESVESNLDSDKALYHLARRVWQRLVDMDEAMTTLSFYIHSKSSKKNDLEYYCDQLDRVWKKIVRLMYSVGASCAKNHPGVIRSHSMSKRRIMRFILLQSITSRRTLEKWRTIEEWMSCIIMNSHSLIQDLPPPKPLNDKIPHD